MLTNSIKCIGIRVLQLAITIECCLIWMQWFLSKSWYVSAYMDTATNGSSHSNTSTRYQPIFGPFEHFFHLIFNASLWLMLATAMLTTTSEWETMCMVDFLVMLLTFVFALNSLDLFLHLSRPLYPAHLKRLRVVVLILIEVDALLKRQTHFHLTHCCAYLTCWL